MDCDRPLDKEARDFLEQHFSESYLEELGRLARALAGRKAGRIDSSGAVGDAVLTAARKHRDLKDPDKFRPWMKTILARKVVGRLRLDCHRRLLEMDSDHLEQVPDARGGSCLADREDEQSWAKSFIGRLLEELSEADREVIRLCRLQGCSDADAARLLDVSEEALRQRRSRAMRRLQQVAQRFAYR